MGYLFNGNASPFPLSLDHRNQGHSFFGVLFFSSVPLSRAGKGGGGVLVYAALSIIDGVNPCIPPAGGMYSHSGNQHVGTYKKICSPLETAQLGVLYELLRPLFYRKRGRGLVAFIKSPVCEAKI